MKNRSIETAVGIFVIIGLICVGYLTIKLGKLKIIGSNTYPIYARFQSVSGLKPGADVEMAGVRIGQVGEITFDNEKKVALVKINILNDIKLSEDIIATVSTSGLIGDKYINLMPGGSDETLKPGDTVFETKSAVNLEEMIGKYVFGGVDKK